jgi:hypothetical protein
MRRCKVRPQRETWLRQLPNGSRLLSGFCLSPGADVVSDARKTRLGILAVCLVDGFRWVAERTATLVRISRPTSAVRSPRPIATIVAIQGFMFGLPHDNPANPGQPVWRFCGKCRMLFFDDPPNTNRGICPGGGGSRSCAPTSGLVFPPRLPRAPAASIE